MQPRLQINEKECNIPVEGKATEAGNTKLLRVKYTMLRKDTGFCAMTVETM